MGYKIQYSIVTIVTAAGWIYICRFLKNIAYSLYIYVGLPISQGWKRMILKSIFLFSAVYQALKKDLVQLGGIPGNTVIIDNSRILCTRGKSKLLGVPRSFGGRTPLLRDHREIHRMYFSALQIIAESVRGSSSRSSRFQGNRAGLATVGGTIG